MSHSSPSFRLLDSDYDSRADQIASLRRNFVLLIVHLIVLGMLTGVEVFSLARLHHFDWTLGLVMLPTALGVFALARVIYRHLPR
jgi:hypothetical protein